MVLWLLHSLVQGLSVPVSVDAPEDPGHAPLKQHWGLHPALYALIFGIISGTSLPLGSWLGIMFSPVSDKTCALMMAFGAGALLFAVTVELYGHALREVAAGKLGLFEMFTTIFGALIGAAFYLTINQWLESYLMHDHSHDCQSPTLPKKGSVAKSLPDLEAPRESDSIMAELRKQRLAAEAQKEKDEKEALAAGVTSPGPSPRRTPRENWQMAAAKAKKIARTMSLMKKNDLQRVRAREKAIRALHDPDEMQRAKSVAFALFLGLLVDGVPEGILMGFLAAEGHLTPVLIISLFIANFPEAFSSASLLTSAKMSTAKIIGMWSGLCLLVGSLGGLSCWLLLWWFPTFGQAGHGNLPMPVLLGIALVEGITGGAMIACISAVMLPEAFERAGKTGPFYSQTGFLCTSGFLLSVALKALFG